MSPAGFQGPVDVVTVEYRNAPKEKTPRNDAEKSTASDEPSQTEMHIRREHVSKLESMVTEAMMAIVSGDAGTALKLLHNIRTELKDA